MSENNYNLSVKRYKIQYCDEQAHHSNKLEKRKEYSVKVKKLDNR